jgi:hypothetical protein
MHALALGHAHASSTCNTYSSALHSYISFCQNHGFDIAPSADTLSFFIVYMSFHIRPSSVESYLSGIQSELEVHFPQVWALQHSLLITRTLQGCKRLRNSEIHCKCPSYPDLHLLLTQYGHSSSQDDLLFVSQVTSGFNALNRLGELVWPENKTLQSYHNVPLRHSIRWHTHALRYLLPIHKADPFFEGNQLFIQQTDPPMDAYQPLLRYLQSRNRLFPGHPVLWLRADSSIPTRQWFISCLRVLFPADVAGQSLRSGGATALALAGVPNDCIQAAGRWSSQAFQAYI